MPTIAADDTVDVAVGVVADRGRFLLTRRAPNAHQGDKWEFPGGKILQHESRLAALRRELREELGIDVGDACPLMQVDHSYPDKRVRLDVWSVLGYSGEPRGREGQELRWASRAELLSLEFPAADLPIQRRLWLPQLYAISDCSRIARSAFLEGLDTALGNGLRLLQLREPILDRDAYLALAREVVGRCHRHEAKVLLNADPAWVELCGADGVHLNSGRLMQTQTRPCSDIHFVAASCHNETELACAAAIGVDLVVLGPVSATSSHARATPMGWDRFRQLCESAGLAVYALGGMHPRDMSRARSHGAQGLAMISGLWGTADIAAAVAACERD